MKNRMKTKYLSLRPYFSLTFSNVFCFNGRFGSVSAFCLTNHCLFFLAHSQNVNFTF